VSDDSASKAPATKCKVLRPGKRSRLRFDDDAEDRMDGDDDDPDLPRDTFFRAIVRSAHDVFPHVGQAHVAPIEISSPSSALLQRLRC
jgi:hypothetical protein